MTVFPPSISSSSGSRKISDPFFSHLHRESPDRDSQRSRFVDLLRMVKMKRPLRLFIEVSMKELIRGFRRQRIRWRKAFLVGSIMTTIVVLLHTPTFPIFSDEETDSDSSPFYLNGSLHLNIQIVSEAKAESFPLVELNSSSEFRSGRKPRHALSLQPKEALAYAKMEMQKAPEVVNDTDLFAPVFRNLSVFKRSYELMELILKVYIYPDGEKPIFHQPHLNGIYASEGWFMKLMESNTQFVTKNPEKAHLFYMPYMNEHPELRRNTIKALCNADLSDGIFVPGKDVSLPETSIRNAGRPLRYIGNGNRVSQRPILAFFAGNLHGRVRPQLLKHWRNKDEDMKIYGPLPHNVARKMTYVQHMKSSKYCLCPMGYEVNSPRIVEAIYYECVPVVIADNFVLPFSEILDWSAFSVVVAEKEIPRLKEILLEIPMRRYLKMQMNVKMVQRHFLWSTKPRRYDVFHMILHSIWFNLLNQNQTSSSDHDSDS
ncbi:unnamed protein product, partial [Thlaspi arvense]